MSSFGNRLKHERESRGISLQQVSEATRVGVHLLEALENGDFSSLPGGPFNKGFVRSYARYLGLDPETAVDAFAREEKASGFSSPDAEREMEKNTSPLVELRSEGDRKTLVLDWAAVQKIAAVFVVLAIVAMGAWFLFPDRPEPVQAADSRIASGAAEIGPEPAADSRPTPSSQHDPPAALADAAATIEASEVAEDESHPESPGPESTAGAPTTDEKDESHSQNPGPEPTTGSPIADGKAAAPEAPTAVAVKAASAPVSDGPSALSIPDAGVGTDVVNRQLVGRGRRFEEGSQVWFWTRAMGGVTGEPLRHVWLLDGRPLVTYELTIGGPHWRNSSLKTLSPGSQGRWSVEARDAAGRVLAHEEFVCVPQAVARNNS